MPSGQIATGAKVAASEARRIDRAPDHAVERAALDVEPARGEAARVGGVREPRPELGVVGLAVRAARRPPGVGDQGNAVVVRHCESPVPSRARY